MEKLIQKDIPLKAYQLNGKQIKKDLIKKGLHIQRVIKRYHNKHKNGSGNFGFTITALGNDGEMWLTLDGEYDSNEEIYVLTLGKFIGEAKSIDIHSYNSFINDLADKIKGFLGYLGGVYHGWF